MKKLSWPTIKSILDSKTHISPQFVEYPKKYVIDVFDGPFSYRCVIFKKLVPSQDQVEWESTYKVNGNKPLSNFDDDGTVMQSPKMSPKGWVLQGLCFDFAISKLNSLNMLNSDGSQYPHGSMLFYDSLGVQLTTQALIDSSCVKTYSCFRFLITTTV